VLAANEFGETETEILSIFQLKVLLDPDFWATVLLGKAGERTEQPQRSATARRVFSRITVLSRELPQIVQLLRRDSDPPVANDKEETEADIKIVSSILTILLKEEINKMSSPRRLVDAIESISIIYAAFAEIDDISDNDLVVIGCDSGSDKSFDFTGVPQIIQQTKDFIFGMWDRIILYREKQHSERVKVVAESLPLLGEIAEMVNKKKLSAEQGELPKRRIIDGATKFLDTGAILPELKEASHFEPQALLQPTPTLLLPAPRGEIPKREPRNRGHRRQSQSEEGEDKGESPKREPRNRGHRRQSQSEEGEDEDQETISLELGDNNDDVGQLSEEEIEIIKRRRRDRS
jgi:hypothetical protein